MSTPDTITTDTAVPDVITPDTITPDTVVPDVTTPETTDPGPLTLPLIRSDAATQLEPRYLVLIHNDDVTTFEYVLYILSSIFLLSEELAEHIAMTAHNNGEAIVVIRPRSEAEKLAKVASGRAHRDGFPLTFSTEAQD